jgi:dCTP deaminase
MAALSDIAIRIRMGYRPGNKYRLVIAPFYEQVRPEGHPSYGLSYCGYDVRLSGDKVRIFKQIGNATPFALRPGEDWEDGFEDRENVGTIIVPGNGFVLGHTMEWFEMPQDCYGQVYTKSTWARMGICLNTTPLEPSWRGQITLEIANLSPHAVEIQAGEGVGQVIFHQLDQAPSRTYAGVYQNQRGVTPARL